MDADYESTAAISQCDLCIVLLFDPKKSQIRQRHKDGIRIK